ncbi:MAG: hypothetical protein ACJAUH_000658 [Saprospiraceae bacterium]|jgi:uncharacterized protein (TIGR02145 family)
MRKLNLLVILALCTSTLFIISCNDDTEPLIEEEPQETVTDVDGNEYQTITLGDQTWMLENLKTTKYNDGTPITKYVYGNDWHHGNTQLPYYQWADTLDLNHVHDEALPFDYYGAMYNHYAIETGKLAPEGWRIPTEQDFKELEAFIATDGNSGHEATVLKSTKGWVDSSGNGTDLYGFNALPNGYINTGGGAGAGGVICTWATTDIDVAMGRRITINLFDEDTILYSDNAIQVGAGIRCIKE